MASTSGTTSGPGTYYFKVTTPAGVASHPVPYTIHAFEDTVYTEFIEDCEARTRALDNPQISDPLYSCQWHLNSRGSGHVNVEAAWAQGVTGEGVNVAVVDDGMYHTHEDLRDNVDSSRNHDYTGNGDIYRPLEHHGTHVAGLIAARDNGIGVRGVAPRATIYGYNYLAGDPTYLNTVDAMTRNRAVTAVSNNSWGPIGRPRVRPGRLLLGAGDRGQYQDGLRRQGGLSTSLPAAMGMSWGTPRISTSWPTTTVSPPYAR